MLHSALAVGQLSLNQGGDGEGGPALRDKELLVRLKQREDYIVLWEERTFFSLCGQTCVSSSSGW